LDPAPAGSYSNGGRRGGEPHDEPPEDRRAAALSGVDRRGGEARVDQAKSQEGSLATKDFADLVQQLHERRWTGWLVLSNAGLVRKIAVGNGRLMFATSSSPDDRLGERLLCQGRISLRQYLDASQAVAPGKRLGAIFVEMGVLTPKELVRAVIEHATDVVYGAFQWTEGRYRLQDGLETSEAITLRMTTPDLILEGIRRIDSFSRIMRGVGGPTAQYTRSEDYERIIAETTLSFEKLSILTSLHETRDVTSICDESTLTDLDVCRTLWAFRVIGAVWRVDAAPKKVALDDDEGLGVVLGTETA
jgi:hypothetical protein